MPKKAPSLRSPTGKKQVLAPVRPSIGFQLAYQAKLDALIAEMQRSIVYHLKAAYRANEPATVAIAQDRAAADILNGVMKKLAAKWLARFDQLAPSLAKWFATGAAKRTDAGLKAALKKSGMTVRFAPSPAVTDAYQAVLAENVGLIKSIAAQHLQEVQGLVNRSIATGRDLGTLSKELEARYGITKRRAALISRDQNSKATAVITKTRQQELGLTTAIWRHSHAGKHPRPEHLKADGKPYEIAKGVFLEGEWVWPGTAINCRCYSRAILPGM